MTHYEISPRTIGLAILLSLLAVGLGASLVYATDVYLLTLLAILAGVLFSNLAKLLGRLLSLPYGVNLTIVVTALVALLAATIFFFGWRIDRQLQETSKRLDQSYDKVLNWLDEHPNVQSLFNRIPFSEKLLLDDVEQTESKTSAVDKTSSDRGSDSNTSDSSSQNTANEDADQSDSTGWVSVGTANPVMGKVFGVLGQLFSTTLGVTMNVAFVFFVGVFLATKPHFYRDNLARLFPKPKRSRVIEILDMLDETLFRWLQGRAATMAITGSGTAVVLWLLGVPLALTLGIVTGILTFIPTVGAFVALLLSMLVALSQGPSTVGWVVVLYAVLQFVESNVVTPLIQQRQTSVPPPLLLASQLMMGVLAGFLGVLVSTPLVASLIVLVREVYIVDVLGDE